MILIIVKEQSNCLIETYGACCAAEKLKQNRIHACFEAR